MDATAKSTTATDRSVDPADIELLTEHLGYPPVSLLDDIINSVNLLAERAVASVEQGLLGAPAGSLGFADADAARAEIERGTHQLETLLCASIDVDFDLLELYAMQNILCVGADVRDWIRLGHYAGLAPNPLPHAPPPDTLPAQLRASRQLTRALVAERSRTDALLARLHAVPPPPAAAPGAAFALAQLPAVRAHSAALRGLLPALSAAEHAGDAGPDRQAALAGGERGWRGERVAYVEAAARRHLQDARGVVLGSQGEVPDAEWRGPGRRITQAEVESLEAVVAALRANTGSGPGGGDGNNES